MIIKTEKLLRCIICQGKLVFKEENYQCHNCQKWYNGYKLIFDFLHNPNENKVIDYSIEFNTQVLYKTIKDLETRIKFFNERFKYKIDAEIHNLLSWINNQSNLILEIGCGTLDPLLKIGFDYNQIQTIYGIDVSMPLLIKASQNFPNSQLFRANAEFLPFNNDCFDLVWARHMLYHTEYPMHVIKEVRRVLKLDGFFCLSTNSAINKPEMHDLHARLLKKLGDQKLLEDKGKRGSQRFPAEKSDLMVREYFKYVNKINYKGIFSFSSNDEFLEYYYSTAYFKKVIKAGYPEEQTKLIVKDLSKNIDLTKLTNNGAIVIGSDKPLKPFL